jgi:putative membrane protein
MQGRVKAAMPQVAWQFLTSLGLGVFAAIFTLAGLISWLMTEHPVLLNAFFFGLIAGSVWVIAKAIKRWSVGIVVGIVVSAIAAYALFGMVPISTPTHPLFLFLCGVIAICAMILPGISGSFILLVLGKYEYVIHAVKDRDLVTLVIFASGCLVGILSFVRVVSWCLKRYHNQTIAILTGFVIGALRKIWPWKETLSTHVDRHGAVVPLEQINVWPAEMNAQLGFALILIVTGVVLALQLSQEPSQSVHE